MSAINSILNPANTGILILEIGSEPGQMLFLNLEDTEQLSSMFEVNSWLSQVESARIEGSEEFAAEAIERFQSAIDYLQSITIFQSGQMVPMGASYLRSDLLVTDIVENYNSGDEVAVLELLRNLFLGVAPLKLKMISSSGLLNGIEREIAELESERSALIAAAEPGSLQVEGGSGTTTEIAMEQQVEEAANFEGETPRLANSSEPPPVTLTNQVKQASDDLADLQQSGDLEVVEQNQPATPVQVDGADFAFISMDDETADSAVVENPKTGVATAEESSIAQSLVAESGNAQISNSDLENQTDVTNLNVESTFSDYVAAPALIPAEQALPEPDLTFYRGEPIFENSGYQHEVPGRGFTNYSINVGGATVETDWSQVQVNSIYRFNEPPEQLLAGERVVIAVDI